MVRSPLEPLLSPSLSFLTPAPPTCGSLQCIATVQPVVSATLMTTEAQTTWYNLASMV